MTRDIAVQHIKINTDVIRSVFSEAHPNNCEQKMMDDLMTLYREFFINARFKHFDRFLSTRVNNMSTSVILLSCLNLAQTLLVDKYPIKVVDIDNFIKIDKTPSRAFAEGLKRLLLTSFAYLENNTEVNTFIRLCIVLQISRLPDMIKADIFDNEGKKIKGWKPLITFNQSPSYHDVEKDFTHVLSIVSKPSVNKLSVVARRYDISHENKNLTTVDNMVIVKLSTMLSV